jgi:hypothetical protein
LFYFLSVGFCIGVQFGQHFHYLLHLHFPYKSAVDMQFNCQSNNRLNPNTSNISCRVFIVVTTAAVSNTIRAANF